MQGNFYFATISSYLLSAHEEGDFAVAGVNVEVDTF